MQQARIIPFIIAENFHCTLPLLCTSVAWLTAPESWKVLSKFCVSVHKMRIYCCKLKIAPLTSIYCINGKNTKKHDIRYDDFYITWQLIMRTIVHMKDFFISNSCFNLLICLHLTDWLTERDRATSNYHQENGELEDCGCRQLAKLKTCWHTVSSEDASLPL